MKRLALLSGCLALWGLLSVTGVRAQAVAPGAPTITTVSSGDDSLTVLWSAPSSDGGSAITSYDLRYVLSDATSKGDDDWTVKEGVWSADALFYVLSGLTKDTSYDLQLRALNATGPGAWSDAVAEATNDHGGSGDTASVIDLGGSIPGRIGAGDDRDYFRISLTESADMLIYTTGPTDTVGTFRINPGLPYTTADDAVAPGNPLNFELRIAANVTVPVTYYVEVGGFEGTATGPYTLHLRAASPGDSTANATEVELGTATPGRTKDDLEHNYFKFELSEKTTVWMYVTGEVDTVMDLYSWDTTSESLEHIAKNDDGHIETNILGPMMTRVLEPGTYYIIIKGYRARSGSYTLHVHPVESTGATTETASPVGVHFLTAGESTSASDHQYYRMVVTSPSWTRVYAQGVAGDEPDVEITLVDNDGNETGGLLPYVSIFRDPGRAFDVTGYLAPGTHYFRVTATVSSSETYALHFLENYRGRAFLDECLPIEHSQEDTFYGCQWHLNNTDQFDGGAGFDINAEEAWETTLGAGVNVAIVDDGMYYEHPDLRENVDETRNHSYQGSDVLHLHETHGTAVAGLVAARDNNLGVRGVAPRATLYAYDLLLDVVDDAIADAMTRNLLETAVSNNSWGFIDNGSPTSPRSTWISSIETGLNEGYGGKGISYVWAAGNGAERTDESNLDGRANYYGVIAVCAVDHRDTRSVYSEHGANLWVCGPSNGRGTTPGITTTTNGGWTADFGGTSAAAPVVSGVVALMRSVNADLTWRDVKLILAASARKNDPRDSGWREGALRFGATEDDDKYSFNHEYGFGMVDAAAAVDLADGWTNAPSMRKTTSTYQGSSFSIPDAPSNGTSTRVTRSLTVDGFVDFVEYVAITVNMNHDDFRDLDIDLVSPSGSVSRLVNDGQGYSRFLGLVLPQEAPLNGEFRMGSARFLGEDPAGEWTLRVTDRQSGNRGRMRGWSLTVYGHGYAPGYPFIDHVEAGDGSLTAEWKAPNAGDTGESEITSYDLSYIASTASDKSDTNWTEVTGIWETDGGALSYELSGLSAGTWYDLRIRAVNDAGAGPWSPSESKGTAVVVSAAPAITLVAPRHQELGVVWREPGFTGGADISGYQVRHIRSDATVDEKAVDANWSATSTPGVALGDGLHRYNILSLENGIGYDVQVLATNSAGDSPWSATVSGTPNLQNTDPKFPESETGARSLSEDTTLDSAAGDAVEATDPDGNLLTYSLSAPSDYFSLDSRTGGLQLTRLLDYEEQTSHTLTVNVSDGRDVHGDNDDAIDDDIVVTVTVVDVNEGFTVDGVTHITRPENSTGVLETYTATDPEGLALTWSVEGADEDKDALRINASGELSFRLPPDHDRPLDANEDSLYHLEVAASDGVNKSELPVTIQVTNVDEAPLLTGLAHVTIAENSDVSLGCYTATDPEGEAVTWRALSGPDASKFELTDGTDPCTRELRFKSPPDADIPADSNRDNRYQVTVNTSDRESGGLPSKLDVTVAVTDVDEPPEVTGPDSMDFDENATGSIATYSATDPEGGTVALRLIGPDSGDFNFSNGVLRFNSTPNYEDPADASLNNTYEVIVEARDVVNTVEHDVTVNVTNVDEPGTLSLSSQQPQVDAELTATLADLDGNISGQSWTWERSQNRSNWSTIGGATGSRYTPLDADLNHYLRVTVDYTDGHGSGKDKQVASMNRTQAAPVINNPPAFPNATEDRSVAENSAAGTPVGAVVEATDPDPGDVPSYTLSGADAGSFAVDGDSGQIRVGVGTMLNREGRDTYFVTVTASDSSNASDSAFVTITIDDVDEPPMAEDDTARTQEDRPTLIDVLGNDRDPEGAPLTISITNHPESGSVTVTADNRVSYEPTADTHGVDRFTYRVFAGPHSDSADVFVTVNPVNDPPEFAASDIALSVSEHAPEGTPVGTPVTATDVDVGDVLLGDVLTYRLSGSSFFEVEPHTAQITVAASAGLEVGSDHIVTITAIDRAGAQATVTVTITVSARVVQPSTIVSFGGGGGGPSGPTPSTVDFEWNVTRDIDALAAANDTPTGMWSDGALLWLTQNGSGADDAVYAYDLATGERVEDREFELDDTNRAPRGVWSNGETAWVADSGQDRLFAYDLETGERDEEREIVLANGNRDARAIWSDGETVWVLNANPSLFVYDITSGALLGEYELADANSGPHGLWSDGVTVWVSDHTAKRLFAYRLPVPPEGEPPEEPPALERVRDEEFAELSSAGNNSPRGLWSDGAVMYVADESDGRVYTYNMPDAIDTRLASLSLSGVEFGEFSQLRYDYASETIPHGNIATLTAVPAQEGATVKIEPPDHDGDPENGHHVRLLPSLEVTITVTSPDGSRERVYRVALADVAEEQVTGPSASCLRGAVSVGFNLVVYEGGSIEDLVACAEGRHVTALYALHEGEFVSYILGAPEFVNRTFSRLFTAGVPVLTALTARSEGPPTPAAGGAVDVEAWPACLRGEIAAGFSLVLYAGGSVQDLAACAGETGVTALYALVGGEYVSYILGAPEFVNRGFSALFPDGLAAATPLVIKGD